MRAWTFCLVERSSDASPSGEEELFGKSCSEQHATSMRLNLETLERPRLFLMKETQVKISNMLNSKFISEKLEIQFKCLIVTNFTIENAS